MIEQERTKQERIRLKTVQASGKETVSGNGHKRSFDDFMSAVASGELSLDMSGSQIGEWAHVSAATGRRWRKSARDGISER